jgi:hypothetical protein
MNIAMNLPVMGCLLVVCAISVGCALAALKSKTMDIVVGVVVFLIVSWVLLSMIRF